MTQQSNRVLTNIRSTWIGSAVVWAILIGAVPASATLMGSTVSLDSRFPNLNTVNANFGPATVSQAFEYSSMYGGVWSSDIDGFSITLNQHAASNALGSASFNGFVYVFVGAPSILSISLDPSSTLVPTSISATGDTVFINYAGYGSAGPSTTILNVSFVPEPSTALLCMLGLLGLGQQARPKRRLKA